MVNSNKTFIKFTDSFQEQFYFRHFSQLLIWKCKWHLENKKKFHQLRMLKTAVADVVNLFYNQRRWMLRQTSVYALYYGLVLLASSLHLIASLAINLGLVVYVLFFLDTSCSSSSSSSSKQLLVMNIHLYVLVLAVGNYAVVVFMVDSYAELLPWELGFHSLFHAMSALYFYWCRERSTILQADNNANKRNMFQFDIKS